VRIRLPHHNVLHPLGLHPPVAVGKRNTEPPVPRLTAVARGSIARTWYEKGVNESNDG
jgi:hypothetical protein